MNPVRELRRQTGRTQAQLAAAAGTSQPTIAAYETGRKSPTLRTLSRMARSVGLEAIVSFVPAMTREERRSLALHRAVADRFVAAPADVLQTAHDNLALMWGQHPNARDLLRGWREVLLRPDRRDRRGAARSWPSRTRPPKGHTVRWCSDRSERTRVYQTFARREAGDSR